MNEKRPLIRRVHRPTASAEGGESRVGPLAPKRPGAGPAGAPAPPERSGRGSFFPLIAAAVTAVLILIGIQGVKTYRDFETLSSQESALRATIEREREAIAELEHRVELLDKNPAALERLAREMLWMAKPGETVIVLPAEADPEAAKTR